MIDWLLFVLDQAAKEQEGLSQFVHNSCLAHALNAVLKHTFNRSMEGDEEVGWEEKEPQHVQF